ncbi:SAF domain-containing protein [Microbacterium sp. B2969]|uniref:SAF domain-containing protein n=1 Tax=Microbacterium alkaliflavum TaxID=3248839 RepID=A0ABW7QF05_9MICO
MLIAAGIALAVVGGLGSWYFFTTVGNTTTVLTVTKDIPRGQQITAQDLGTLQIAGDQATNALKASQSQEAIGEVAMVDLPAGSLVTSSTVGKSLVVADGDSIVGVALTSAQMPSQTLVAGDKVRLVDTPIAQGEPPATTPQTFTATVFSVRQDTQNNRWIIDLVVSPEKAPDIAARAATGRVALVLDAGN